MANLANVAAQIHYNMCMDPGFGYSWAERYGDVNDPVYYEVDGNVNREKAPLMRKAGSRVASTARPTPATSCPCSSVPACS